MYQLLYLSRKTHLASPKIRKISRINTRFKHNICTSQRRHSEVLFFGKQRETFSTTSKTKLQNKRKKDKYRAPLSPSSPTNFKPLQHYGCIPSKIKQTPSHHPRISSPRFTQAVRPLYLVVLSKVRKQSNTLTNKQLKHKQLQNS